MSSPKSYKSIESESKTEEMILNSNNIFLTKKTVEDMLLLAGIKEKINDLSLWQQAFVHTSYTSSDKNKQLSPEYKFNRYNQDKHFYFHQPPYLPILCDASSAEYES